ncbi:MAG: hypothetical protein EXX96DRAFT_541751 [Benjaminiella poitrasii]|nr:MAG: hypothetical protein EXX96DRAFT_541751 [Benjaminiella poitrasii]
MRKLFISKKKKRPEIELRPSDIKIPIPMINGIQFADMTDSQLTALLSNRPREDTTMTASSISNPSRVKSYPVGRKAASLAHVPTLSSPPVLSMPTPIRGVLPPTRFLLRTYEDEKTQVENDSSSSSSSEDESSSDEEFIMTSNTSYSNKPIKESKEQDYQSSADVTRTSDDSILPYISASESLFPTTTTSSDLSNFSPTAAALPTTTETKPFFSMQQPTMTSHDALNEPEQTNYDNPTIRLDKLSHRSSSESNQPRRPTFNEGRPSITEERRGPETVDISAATKRQTTSSSDSSLTMAHDLVTHYSQNSLVESSNKLSGTQSQLSSSEISDALQNKVLEPPTIDASSSTVASMNQTKRIEARDMLQSQLERMALSDDLLELKRTVDRMQQQRLIDHEEHLKRVQEQKSREKEIFEQIDLTKKRLEEAIAAGKLRSAAPETSNAADALHHMDSRSHAPTLSNSVKSAKHKRKPSGDNSHRYRCKPQNRRSFPSMPSHLPPFDYRFAKVDDNPYLYPQDYDVIVNKNRHQAGPADAANLLAPQHSHPRRPRSKSMESRWSSPEFRELEDLDDQERYHFPSDMSQYYPDDASYFMGDDSFIYLPCPPPQQYYSRSRKSSLHSAKSNLSDNDDRTQQPPLGRTTVQNRDQSTREPGKSAPRGAHSARHSEDSDSDRPHFRQPYYSGPHPGMGQDTGMMLPSSSMIYHRGEPGYRLQPPFMPPIDLDGQEGRRQALAPMPPLPYRFNNTIPPARNEFLSYMPPISPQLMAALPLDDPSCPWGQPVNRPGKYPPHDDASFPITMFPCKALASQEEQSSMRRKSSVLSGPTVAASETTHSSKRGSTYKRFMADPAAHQPSSLLGQHSYPIYADAPLNSRYI